MERKDLTLIIGEMLLCIPRNGMHDLRQQLDTLQIHSVFMGSERAALEAMWRQIGIACFSFIPRQSQDWKAAWQAFTVALWLGTTPEEAQRKFAKNASR